MKKKPLIFVSYAGVDISFMQENIIPLLSEIECDIWFFPEKMDMGNTISETLIKGIKKSDLVISLINSKSIYTHFEIGAAFGNNKPVLAIIDKEHEVYTFLNQLRYLRYNESWEFKGQFIEVIKELLENVINKNNFTINKRKKIIGIQVGHLNENFEEDLKFTSEFIDLIKEFTENPKVKLLETSKGSFKTLISLDPKSFTELLEKIIFIIPELKRRKSERLKVDAEVDKIKAETRSINADTDIKQAEAIISLFERYTNNGVKIQIDKQLLISQDENGLIVIKTPNKTE